MIEQVLNDIRWLFENRGRQRYESSRKPGVNQVEHALQTATLAEAAGADDALVTAALLHDLGHMMYLDAEDFHGVDDLHEYRSLPLLRSAFDESILGPIKLHEDAKRLLCTIEADYYGSLSVDGKRSLGLQGGPFSVDEAARFIRMPHAREAILIRRWDDRANVKGLTTPGLDHFLFIASRCLAEQSVIAVPHAPLPEPAHATAERAAA
ncbi:MAG: HD domain-containing protein [Burkholderiales bacterium]